MSRMINAVTPLGETLKFSSMGGREELSRLYEFQVELLSESHTVVERFNFSDAMKWREGW